MLFKSPFVAILIVFFIILGGCDDSQQPIDKPGIPTPVPEKPTKPKEVIFLEQGFSDDDRSAFYYLSQGSQLLPYAWFLALETSDDQTLFRSDDNMRALGYIPQVEDSDWNPDGLPIGFVKDDDPKTVMYDIKKEFLGSDYDKEQYPSTNNAWLGLTCANCHTSEISYQDQIVRIEGGSSQADNQAFLAQLIEALQATTRSDDKMTRFAHRVLDPNWNQGEQDALKQRVDAYTPALVHLRDQNKTELRYGYGRLDAFGSIFNRVLETGLEIPANNFPANAPVSYPFLWDTAHFDWVQYNSSAGNPIARNVGEVLGVYAHLQLQGTPETGQFSATANIKNLDRLEGYVEQLKAPPWPVKVLGEIDANKAALGKQLYAQNCVQCHYIRDENGNFPMTTENRDLEGNKSEVQFIRTNSSMPLAKLGTDPQMVQNILNPKYTVDPGVLRPLLTPEDQQKDKVARVIVLKAAVRAVIKRKLVEMGLSKKELGALAFQLSGQRTPPFVDPTIQLISTYRARPLDGIWATGPFLHNGSVPNLNQLLLPAEQRVTTFRVGSNQFDPVNVGFVTDEGFEFDATLPGNLNSGHSGPMFTQNKPEGGSYKDFTDEERMALIEYMKTLN